MERLLEEFPNDVRFVYRHFPLIGTPESPFHDKASLAARGADAAGNQGKFWEMHDVLFTKQSEWSGLSVTEFEGWLAKEAETLDLDLDQFNSDLQSQELIDLAQGAWDFGNEVGIPGTPFILINGNSWPTNVSMDYFNVAAVVKLTLLEDLQFTQCPPMTVDADHEYIATLHTEKGDVVIKLFPDTAPLAVNNFIFLAQNGWYDGVTFHRVLPGFIAQAGDPTGTGFGGPGYAFKNEVVADLKYDRPGLVGMANAGPDTNGSQFFITYASAPNLDGSYTIFGEVIEGMDVLASLTPRDPSQNADLPPGDKIINITIETK